MCDVSDDNRMVSYLLFRIPFVAMPLLRNTKIKNAKKDSNSSSGSTGQLGNSTFGSTGHVGSTSGCVGFKHICSGGGRGNCCAGYQCIGPVLFGMCTPSACVAEGEICAGFGQGNCCDGQCLAVMAPVPGPGRCAPYNCGEKGGGCTGFGRGSCCAGLTCKTNGLPGILSTCRL